MTDRETLMELLEKRYPNMFLRTTEQFDGEKGGIWTSAEDGIMIGNRLMFNYYSQDNKEATYIMGVHKSLVSFLEQHGWYAQYHDAGTVMFYTS